MIRTPEHKIMPRNGFLHFAESASLRDFTAPSMPLFDAMALAAPPGVSKTRMNTGFSPTQDAPKCVATFLLTRVRFL
jgi:hypothetical protein